jgi:signal transduction histidine kinase
VEHGGRGHLARENRRLRDELRRAERMAGAHDTLQLARVSPEALLEEVESELVDLCKDARVELWTRVAPDLPPFLADSALLRTALLSVVEHALTGAGDDGELSIELERAHGEAGSFALLRVSDRGRGERIDTLGLTIASGIARDHGGRLRFDESPVGGTVVTIEIPLVE